MVSETTSTAELAPVPGTGVELRGPGWLVRDAPFPFPITDLVRLSAERLVARRNQCNGEPQLPCMEITETICNWCKDALMTYSNDDSGAEYSHLVP